MHVQVFQHAVSFLCKEDSNKISHKINLVHFYQNLLIKAPILHFPYFTVEFRPWLGYIF